MKRLKKKDRLKQGLYNYSLLGPKFSNNLKLDRIELRLSQIKIVNFLMHHPNVGIVFATSLGKTIIDILFIDAVWLLDEIYKRERKKFLILVPTIDLADQFASDMKFFRKFAEEDVVVLASLNAKKRREALASEGKIFISTPQGVKNDIAKEKIAKDFFQYLILDEAHHGQGKYAYTAIAQMLEETIKIAQTATAGDKKKRGEIIEILNLENWYRPRIEEELSWLNPILSEKIFIPLNEKENKEWFELETDLDKLYEAYRKKIYDLLEKHFSNLIARQASFSHISTEEVMKKLRKDKNFSEDLLRPAEKMLKILKQSSSLTFSDSEKLKNYILGLGQSENAPKMLSYWTSMRQIKEISGRIFQEGYRSTFDYYRSLEKSTSRASLRTRNDLRGFITKLHLMQQDKIQHPKLVEIVKILQKHHQEQIIIFLNHVKPLMALSKSLEYLGYENSILVGKAHRKIQTQAEAQEIIASFRSGEIRILLVSPVGFEGRHFPNINVGIALNVFISPEQFLQAMGRLGRTKINDTMYFLLFGKYDRGMYYANLRKIKKLYMDIDLIPDEYTPIDPILETCNLPLEKHDFWASELISENRSMIRERFLITDVRVYPRHIYFLLKDKTGFANAVLHIDYDTEEKIIRYYQSLKGKICIVSGRLIVEYFEYIGESAATIDMYPYPDRQNIGQSPHKSFQEKDYE